MIDVISLLDQPRPSDLSGDVSEQMPFKEAIQVNDLSFRYSENSPWILKNLNLRIPKGSKLGIVGMTGCGKSTLVDILMGLLAPTRGDLCVDGQKVTFENKRSWQDHISSVPQHIYLTDATIEENIAFGVAADEIDRENVVKAATLAQISDLVSGWKDGYSTLVGERGMRISGGQRQRIGIARAFYNQSDIIFFDEATSALDDETEQAVMHAVDGLDENITIVIIAHRLTTLKRCDQILKLDNNFNAKLLSYEELMKLNLERGDVGVS